MKICHLIRFLIKMRYCGYKYINFYVDKKIPPVDYCTYNVSNVLNTVTLINNSSGDYTL